MDGKQHRDQDEHGKELYTMSEHNHEYWMRQAIAEAHRNVQHVEGGPFGAIVVKDGQVIGRGRNLVTALNDPTAHAEVQAIREACKHLEDFQLKAVRFIPAASLVRCVWGHLLVQT